jgi:hypothetical protein
MANAIDHARISSALLSKIDTDAVLIATAVVELAAAHAQASRAWSAIGRDQAITEAAARRGVPVGHTRCGKASVK